MASIILKIVGPALAVIPVRIQSFNDLVARSISSTKGKMMQATFIDIVEVSYTEGPVRGLGQVQP
ncbi:MAG: hypothetical protein CM15mP49_33220 [Actinomycetota bacterium]|nr:MAG: hypothetical protein CM15mP49_33220 [Actinomycetota bacterium]